MKVKRIKFERTGGFAGIRFAADFELDDLPEDQAHQLRNLLDDVDFNGLPENLIGISAIPDGFTYAMTVEFESGQHTVTTADGAYPETLQPLLDLLTQIAKQQARKK